MEGSRPFSGSHCSALFPSQTARDRPHRPPSRSARKCPLTCSKVEVCPSLGPIRRRPSKLRIWGDPPFFSFRTETQPAPPLRFVEF
jgi:hypothetical protein